MNKKNLKKILVLMGIILNISTLSTIAMQNIDSDPNDYVITTIPDPLQKIEYFKELISEPLSYIKDNDPLLYTQSEEIFNCLSNKISDILITEEITDISEIEELSKDLLSFILNATIEYNTKNLNITNSEKIDFQNTAINFENLLIDNINISNNNDEEFIIDFENIDILEQFEDLETIRKNIENILIFDKNGDEILVKNIHKLYSLSKQFIAKFQDLLDIYINNTNTEFFI